MAVSSDHNKVDPQAPTKTGQPAPVFFPAVLHRRVSHSNYYHLPVVAFPFYPHFYHQSVPWSTFYQMAGPSRSGQRDRKVNPPRPPNAWILYRSYQSRQIRDSNNQRMSQAAVSKIISDMWRRETEEVKRHFEHEAETKKAQHQELYPDYRFCPKRKDGKQSRKKSKCHDTTPSDADADENNDDNAPPAAPVFPPVPYVTHPQTQSLLVAGYPLNMPQPYIIPYLPELHYGPGGPSPPMSAAPSPAPRSGSGSPLQPYAATSSSSSPSTRPSSSSESRLTSSSSQISMNPTHLPPSNFHHPSPNSYATLSLSTVSFQNSTPAELPLTSPQPQLRSTENTVTPVAAAWNNASPYLPSSNFQNPEEVVNLDIPISQPQNFAEFQQDVTSCSSFDSLQALLSRTDENGVFNLSNIESSDFLAHPNGDLEVVMGPQASTIDYCEELFADFDFTEFQRQMDSLREGSSSSVPATSHSVQEDLQSLFYTPNNPELQAYTATQQRQPSIFTQDMMNFLNFEAAEDSTVNTSSAVFPAPLPTTVAPQQVRIQSAQVAAATPIFTQMTNTPTVVPGTPYVPPAGAIYSSTRRVAGSWKPSPLPLSQMEVPVPSWML